MHSEFVISLFVPRAGRCFAACRMPKTDEENKKNPTGKLTFRVGFFFSHSPWEGALCGMDVYTAEGSNPSAPPGHLPLHKGGCQDACGKLLAEWGKLVEKMSAGSMALLRGTGAAQAPVWAGPRPIRNETILECPARFCVRQSGSSIPSAMAITPPCAPAAHT